MKLFWLPLLCIVTISCNNTSKKDASEITTPIEVVSEIDLSHFIAKDYLIDDQHSYIGFKIKYFGFSPVRGRFNSFRGTVFYNPDNLAHTFMNVNIDVQSINTGNETRDKDLLRGNGWFNASKHPYIKFQSNSIEVQEGNRFIVTGDFSMNGISKEIAITFEKPTKITRDWAENEQVDFSGRLTINRKDYDIEEGEFWDTVLEDGLTQLSNEVTIELDIHTRRADYTKRYATLEADDPRKVIIDHFNISSEKGMLLLKEHLENPENPLSSGAVNTIGNTLLSKHKTEEAQQVFEMASNTFSENAMFLKNLGICYLLKENRQEAKKQFVASNRLDSTTTVANAYLTFFNLNDSDVD